jgi:hypothetical protein
MSYFRSTAGRVVSCVLYLIAGVLSGSLIFFIMAIWRGGSPAITTYISFFGSLLLVIAGITALFGFRGTGFIAIAGIIASLAFYMSSDYTKQTPASLALAVLFILVLSIYPVASIVSMLRTPE